MAVIVNRKVTKIEYSGLTLKRLSSEHNWVIYGFWVAKNHKIFKALISMLCEENPNEINYEPANITIEEGCRNGTGKYA